VIVTVVVVVAVTSLTLGVACFHRRLGWPMWLMARRGSRKRRVVVMHSNSLYDGDASSKHQHQHPHPHQQLGLLVPPRVKVETSSGRGNRLRLLSTVFEYDIPLDPQWEFPRDKLVGYGCHSSTMACCAIRC